MSNAPRNSILNERHRALGSALDSSWNDMAIPQNYDADPYEETTAVRTRAGLFDVSALKIIDVSGPDALAVLNHLVTSDVSKIAPGRSRISSVVNDQGGLIDDILIYADGDGKYRVSHGGGAGEEALAAVAQGKNVQVARDDDVHILSLQGPLALDLLKPHAKMDLKALPYFGHARTTLFGKSVSIARGGYSGERGYEVFCAAKDAVDIFDTLVEVGRPRGAIPVSWSCLDIVRVESALLFFPFDMPNPDTTPWEVRMGWSVDLSKPDFRGKRALEARRGKERTLTAGLEVWSGAAIEPGTKIFEGGSEVGTVNSTTYSQHLMKSLALVSLRPDLTALGTQVEVHAGGKPVPAHVVQTPFYDPMRLRTHPVEERG